MASGNLIAESEKKKILYIASYHIDKGEWTSGIKSGIDSVLSKRKNVVLKSFNMDTRLTRSDEVKKAAAEKAKKVIETWKPDVVIASDDNASKYLIAPYFKDSELPFVFCGVNWDASVYGFPYKNVTGMIEVQLIEAIVDHLSKYAPGKKIGTLRGDTLTNRKEQKHFENMTKTTMKTRYVTNYTEWKKQFIKLQKEVDMLVLGSVRALNTEGHSLKSISDFVINQIKIPTAAYDSFMKDISLITLSTIPEEQGVWAAEKAIEILNGKSLRQIPIIKNKKAKIFLNMKLAKKLNIKFPIELIERSHLISAE